MVHQYYDQVWKGLSNLDPRDPGGFYKKKTLLSLSIHSLKKFVPHASEILTKLYGPNYTQFCVFWQKKKINRVDTILEDVSVDEIIV